MGRNVDIGALSEEEQKTILEVIQRDFNLRKKENERIGKLNQEIKVKQQEATEKVKDTETFCVTCGNKFIWLFNPKVQCSVCQANFCKYKDACGNLDKATEALFCHLCMQHKEIQGKSLDWFYSQLKHKFRRHGGAKIVREFYKRKKGSEGAPPPKPPRININGVELQQETESETLGTITEEDDTPNNTETESTSQSEMRRDIEDVIASTILPKFDELKESQSRDQLHAVDSSKLAEEIIDRLLNTAPGDEKIDLEDSDDDNALMRRYLRDHKQSVLRAILRKIGGEQEAPPSGNWPTNRSPQRDAETMTEASDSEFDSTISGSLRSRSSIRTSLSERMRNLSPDSLRNMLNTNQLSTDDQRSVVQGVVMRKDQLIVEAELDSVLGEIVDSGEHDQPQEFSTEIKFTAVGVDQGNFFNEHSDSGSNPSEDGDVGQENWILPTGQPKTNSMLRTSAVNSSLPRSDTPTAYDQLRDATSQRDFDDEVQEEQVQPVRVNKSFSEVSARSISSDQCEFSEPEPPMTSQRRSVTEMVDDDIVNAINRDLDKEVTSSSKQNSERNDDKLVNEEPIEPKQRDVRGLYQSVVPLASAVSAFQLGGKRVSEDSAYQSDAPAGQGKHRSGEGSDTVSSGSSLDGSTRVSPKRRPRLIDSEKNTLQPTPLPRQSNKGLQSGDQIFREDSISDQLILDAIERRAEFKSDEQTVFSEDQKSEVSDLTNTKETNIVIEDPKKTVRFASEREDSDTELESDVNGFEEEDTSEESEDGIDSSTTEEDYDVDRSDVMGQTNRVETDAPAPVPATSITKTEDLEDTIIHDSEDSGSNRGSPVKSIDVIMADLRHAGLSGEKCAIKRSSLNASPTAAHVMKERSWKSQSTPSPQRFSSTKSQSPDLEKFGFTVDPANYKKPVKTKKQNSLLELLESDKKYSQLQVLESSPSVGETTPERVKPTMTQSDVKTTKPIDDVDVTSSISVVERRSKFADKTSGSPVVSKSVSDSEGSSLTSSIDRATGYDADSSTMTSAQEISDDDHRSMTPKSNLPDVVNVKNNEVVNPVTETPIKASPNNPNLQSLQRSGPARGSITMRGRRMVMTSSPDEKNKVTFQKIN